VNILTLLLESERCAIRSWSAVCDMTFGKDPRTYALASRILNEEIEHEAWFIELLAHERTEIQFRRATSVAVNRSDLCIRTHQKEEMRRHRISFGLPAP
jgi:hypothetical protein